MVRAFGRTRRAAVMFAARAQLRAQGCLMHARCMWCVKVILLLQLGESTPRRARVRAAAAVAAANSGPIRYRSVEPY